jgi:hypothetical protein
MNKILSRIEAALGAPGLTQSLIDLTPSDLQSLLLEVTRARSRTLSPIDLLDEKRGLCSISQVDARALHAYDALAFSAATDFVAVELSPVEPIGSAVVLGNVDQNSTLAALRNTEVLADPTVAMALECARRRRANNEVVKLCASHRCIRMQPFDNPAFSRHFRLFALVTAGRDAGGLSFECEALRDHIAVYLRLLRNFVCKEITVELADTGLIDLLGIAREEIARSIRAHNHAADKLLENRKLPLPRHLDDPASLPDSPSKLRLSRAHEQIILPLAKEFPEAKFGYDLHRLEGVTYYRGLCFRVNVVDPEGVFLPLADGGFTDWTQRLLSNQKERLLTSGIGSEVVVKRLPRRE